MTAADRTKQFIAESLINLSNKKRLSKISVTDLCKECSINRSTFYYHFKDIQDVIQWVYHTEVSEPVREKMLCNANPKDTAFVTRDVMNSIYKHREFYMQAVLIEGQNSLEEYVLEEAKENWSLLIDVMLENSNKKKSDLDAETASLLDAAIEYYCYAHYIVTLNWMKRGMDIDPNKLAELIDTVALQGFDKVIEKYT